MFNHESPRRGETFVTRKITRGLSAIYNGKQKCLYLGNLDAMRDWGHARDYAEAMWLILQHDRPDDFVVSTGIQYSVRQFVEKCAAYLGWDIIWRGSGSEEVGICANTDKVIIRVDPIYYRPTEVNSLLGDSSKANNLLGWKPKFTIDNLVDQMMSSDLNLTK